MKLYAYIFTFDRDIDILEYCLKSTLRTKEHLEDGDELVVTVVNDVRSGKSALTKEKALSMGADRYIETTFDRHGNLNGAECIEGMLQVYLDNTPEDADYAMQLDADCLLQDIAWAKTAKSYNAALAGQLLSKDNQTYPMMIAIGPGMLLSRYLCTRLLAMLKNADVRQRIDSGPGNSDVMISVMTDSLRIRSVKFSYEEPPTCKGSNRKAKMAYYYRTGYITSEEELKASCIVNVDRRAVGGKHELVLSAMKDWYDKYVSHM